jgi:hypothetical protein
MKKILILNLVFLLVLPALSFAQGAKKKTLSDKDKQVIIDIFKELKYNYYLEFSSGEAYGNKGLMPPGLFDAIKQNKSSGQTAGYFYRTHTEIGLWYAVQTGAGAPQTLEAVFGKTNATRLHSIMKKYGIAETAGMSHPEVHNR